MSGADDDRLLHDIVKAIEAHISDQIRWHIERGSTGNKDQLFDIAVRMEAEKLEKRAVVFDEEGKDEAAEVIRELKDILPAILSDLRQRI